MNPSEKPFNAAFTLVEVMIVVVILGVLAGIVIPRLSSATDNARNSGALSQLTSTRQQLEAWRMDHQGIFPTLEQLQQGPADWAVFTRKTALAGEVDDAGRFGPYFSSPPLNTYMNSSLVAEAGSPVTGAGWTYDQDTGMLRIIVPQGIDMSNTVLGPGDLEFFSPN